MAKKIKNLIIILLIAGVFSLIGYYFALAPSKSTLIQSLADFPDSLTNHIPRYTSLFSSSFSRSSYSGYCGGTFRIEIRDSKFVKKFIHKHKLDSNIYDIDIKHVFHIKNGGYDNDFELYEYGDSLVYPFLSVYNDTSFTNYDLIYYDFDSGVYCEKESLKVNDNLSDKWKHGYSRGVLLNRNDDNYIFWISVW